MQKIMKKLTVIVMAAVIVIGLIETASAYGYVSSDYITADAVQYSFTHNDTMTHKALSYNNNYVSGRFNSYGAILYGALGGLTERSATATYQYNFTVNTDGYYEVNYDFNSNDAIDDVLVRIIDQTDVITVLSSGFTDYESYTLNATTTSELVIGHQYSLILNITAENTPTLSPLKYEMNYSLNYYDDSTSTSDFDMSEDTWLSFSHIDENGDYWFLINSYSFDVKDQQSEALSDTSDYKHWCIYALHNYSASTTYSYQTMTTAQVEAPIDGTYRQVLYVNSAYYKEDNVYGNLYVRYTGVKGTVTDSTTYQVTNPFSGEVSNIATAAYNAGDSVYVYGVAQVNGTVSPDSTIAERELYFNANRYLVVKPLTVPEIDPYDSTTYTIDVDLNITTGNIINETTTNTYVYIPDENGDWSQSEVTEYTYNAETNVIEFTLGDGTIGSIIYGGNGCNIVYEISGDTYNYYYLYDGVDEDEGVDGTGSSSSSDDEEDDNDFSLWDWLKEVLAEILGALFELIKEILTAIVRLLIQLVTGLWDFISDLLVNAVAYLTSFFEAIGEESGIWDFFGDDVSWDYSTSE